MSATFGYRADLAPEKWGSLCSEWKIADTGKQQSPIDICTSSVSYDEQLKPLVLGWQDENDTLLKNNGKSPTWFVQEGKHFLKGSKLPSDYEMIQFHIHFSHEPTRGSEHSVNGVFHAAEIHFVHWKKAYGSFTEALKHSDGLAVVGTFIDIEDNSNLLSGPFDEDLHKSLSQIQAVDSEVRVPMRLSSYEISASEYYTYPGSLTTPGCAECVVWLMTSKPLYMSQNTYDAMKNLDCSEGGKMCQPGNYRPVQSINNRTVHSSFNTTIPDTA